MAQPKHRASLSLISIDGAYRTHIAPVIDRPWVEVTVADCERLRDALDAKARDGSIASKTAFNVWSVWTTAAKAAAGQWKKDESRKLRARDDNPCAGIAAPDRDGDKELQWLYPNELIQLVSSEDVPLEYRRPYALVTYLFLRGGELKALTWPDVDIEHGIISVRRSYDRNTGRIKQTKTGNKGMRRFAIEPALLPLIRTMHAEANGEGHVVTMRQQKWWAADLRKHLEAAGINREALYSTDDTRKRLRFHDLRGTGLTWMAIRGDDPLKIKQRAGHRTFEMAQKCIRTAEAVGEVIGEVFPPLPESLAAGRYRQEYRPSDVQLVGKIVDTIATNSNRGGGRAGVCVHPGTLRTSKFAPTPSAASPGPRACDTLPTWPNRSCQTTSNSAFSPWPRLTAWRSLRGYSLASRAPTRIETRLGAPSWAVATPSSTLAPSSVSRLLRFMRALEPVCDRVVETVKPVIYHPEASQGIGRVGARRK